MKGLFEFIDNNEKKIRNGYVIFAVGYLVIHLIVAICTDAPGF